MLVWPILATVVVPPTPHVGCLLLDSIQSKGQHSRGCFSTNSESNSRFTMVQVGVPLFSCFCLSLFISCLVECSLLVFSSCSLSLSLLALSRSLSFPFSLYLSLFSSPCTLLPSLPPSINCTGFARVGESVYEPTLTFAHRHRLRERQDDVRAGAERVSVAQHNKHICT